MVTHGWFVCPTVSMVTTNHATGLEKTLLSPLFAPSEIVPITYKRSTK